MQMSARLEKLARSVALTSGQNDSACLICARRSLIRMPMKRVSTWMASLLLNRHMEVIRLYSVRMSNHYAGSNSPIRPCKSDSESRCSLSIQLPAVPVSPQPGSRPDNHLVCWCMILSVCAVQCRHRRFPTLHTPLLCWGF